MTTQIYLKGFSLIELIVVIGLVTALGSATAIGSLESYGHALRGNAGETAESVLRLARNNALAGVCATEPCMLNRSHGAWLGDGFISLQDSAGLRLESYPLEGTITESPSQWLFIAGSGTTASATQALLSSTESRWEIELTVTEAGMIESVRKVP